MKNILILSFLIWNTALSAQTNWCGTVPSESFLQSYAAKDRSNYQSYLSGRDGIRWIPVWYHIIVKNDGSGGVNLKDVFIAHCEMNDHFNPFNIGFFIQGIDTIFNTVLWEYQNSFAWGGVFNQNNKSNVCNVYVNGNLPGLCGFATLPYSGPSGGGIFLNKSCIGPSETTYAHEMGHYLGLLHTFENGFGVEYVNGSNCVWAGDRFCDTPADFLDSRTSCPYLGDQTDPNGDYYRTVIDPTLIMSYFSDNCVNRFSPMQQAEMNRVLTQDRPELLTIPAPDLSAPASVQMVSPVGGDLNVNSSNTTFKWRAVDNARFYHLRLQSSSSPLVLNDTIVTDTSFIATGMAPNKKYKFFVKAISFGNACGSEAPYQNIQTSAVKATVTVTNPTCSGSADGSAVVTPVSGTPPFVFQWGDGSTDSTIYNLSPGDYYVTVMDNNGVETVILVSVANTDPFTVNFNIGPNSVLALATGGTVPYTFVWSNGVIGQYNNNLPYGNYSVTVTDARGCSSVKNILYNSLVTETDVNFSMKLFPNPAKGMSVLNVQVELEERTEATISLFNISGGLISEMNHELPAGKNQLPLYIGTLPTGVYLVRFQSGKAFQTERLAVIR